MTLILDDRIQETSVTSGTGTLTLAGAVVGFKPFSTIGNGNTTYYCIFGAVDWEVGLGTYNAGTLTRTTVLSSSNSNSLVNFTAETKNVFVDLPASKAIYRDAAGLVPEFATAAQGALADTALQGLTSTDGSIGITGTGTTKDLSVLTASSTQNTLCQVRNTTGSTLVKGTVVYISGATGQIPTVSKALATSDATSAQTLGLITADIPNNTNGYVTVIGIVNDIDTSAFTDGAQLYLSATTAGTFTATKQYAPAHLVYVGVVEYAHPVHGKIFVKVQNGYEMDELHNVSAQTPSNGNVLIWNNTTQLWEAASLTAGTNVTITNAPGSITIAATAGSGGVSSFNTRTGAVTLTSGDVTGALGSTAVTNATNASISTNIAGGTANQIPYQTSINTTNFIAAPTVASYLNWNGTSFNWTNPTGAGTVTSVGGTGTVSGISLSGTVTSSGNLTLGGSLDLSSPPAIGGTTPAAVTATNLKLTGGSYAEGVFGGTFVDGIVVDYNPVGAVGRISVGSADGLNFYNGGVAGSLLGSISNNGDWSITRFLDVGNGTLIGGATNPIIAAAGSANQYVQNYIHNDNSGASASSDFAAYPDNGTDASGWIDMGITSSTYSDVAYPITGANEGYIFMSAPSGASKTGNLVYATDSTGTSNAHQWYSGGFGAAKSSWEMQLNSTNLTLAVPLVSNIATGTAPFTVASTTNVANLNASSLNGATFAAPGAIGGTTAAAITGTTITANTAFAGALNGTVGATTPNTGAFTTLSASSTVSGTGFSTYLASPPAIGGTTAAAGSFTTLSASSTVSGTGFSTYLASPPAIGGTAAAAGTFTQLTVNGANVNTSISPTGTGTVAISPVGALTINPTAASTINNASIGATTAASGRFTNAIITASAGTTAPLQLTSGTNLATAAAGTFEYDGSSFYSSVAASTRGVLRTEQMVVLNTTYTLTSQTAAQKLFNATTNGAVTLPIGTYQFECFYSLTSMSATSGSFGFAMVAGTAVIGSQGWWSLAEKGTATLATATATQSTYNTAANTTLATASVNTTGYAFVRGIIKITTAGTVIPSVSLGVAAAAIVGINSYFKVSPVTGASAANITVGNWS